VEPETQDRLQRAYARLVALRKTLGADTGFDPQFDEKYVREYHGALEHLEAVGFDVEEFKVPASEVDHRVTGGNYVSGKTRYSEEKFVDRGILLTKLDAVLTYFEFKTVRPEEPKREIGFHSRTK